MILNLNQTLINTDNVCTIKRYYQITKTPGQPELKDYPRMYIKFLGGVTEVIEFETAEFMDFVFDQIIKLINK